MNKEQEQIIDEEYALYLNESRIYNYPESFIVSKEEFINKCKTDTEFSETWGLKIEERELSLEERNNYYTSNYLGLDETKENLDKMGIPTKLITITYNNKTIESYE